MYKKNHKRLVCLSLLIVLAVFMSGAAMANPFKGNGKQNTKQFKLPAGIYLFEIDHKGFNRYEFYFKHADGSKPKLLAKGTGPYKGIVVTGVEPSQKKTDKPEKAATNGDAKYFIAAVTDGPWQVSIMSCKKETDKRSFEGETETREATGLFSLKKGTYEFKLKHKGGRQFQAVLLNGYGRKVGVLAQGAGNIDTKTRVSLPRDGEYIIDITASGKWNVEVSEALKK